MHPTTIPLLELYSAVLLVEVLNSVLVELEKLSIQIRSNQVCL